MSAKIVMDYDVIVDTVHGLTREGWHTKQLTRADGYPIFALTDAETAAGNVADDRPSLLVVAGVHGEEPAGVVGLRRWLVNRSAEWIGRLRLHVIPCLNPWGYERGIRFDAGGHDLNRQFDAPRHKAVEAFNAWVQQRSFDLFMDLHEDEDFKAMYAYELMVAHDPHTPTLARTILDNARAVVPLSHDEEVGDLRTEHGLIFPSLNREQALSFEQRPIAIHVFAHVAPHVVTVETPGLQPLDVRAQLHVDALEAACRYLLAAAVE